MNPEVVSSWAHSVAHALARPLALSHCKAGRAGGQSSSRQGSAVASVQPWGVESHLVPPLGRCAGSAAHGHVWVEEESTGW